MVPSSSIALSMIFLSATAAQNAQIRLAPDSWSENGSFSGRAQTRRDTHSISPGGWPIFSSERKKAWHPIAGYKSHHAREPGEIFGDYPFLV